MSRRVVFDTGVVISALLFAGGRLAWLRRHWREGGCIPLVSRTTAAELTRVLAYPKFRLNPGDRHDLLAEYLPFCEALTSITECKARCRDVKDQPFLDLAQSGNAEFLVTGDADLMDMAGRTRFSIVSAAEYMRIARNEG